MQTDRLQYEERIGDSWINNHTFLSQKDERYYQELTSRYDQFPYEVLFIRSGLENEITNRWNQAAFVKCNERLGYRGINWTHNYAFCYFFKNKKDAFWFKMTCGFNVLQF